MKLIVSKDEIQQKLSNIQNIVEKRNTMPILSHFLLDANKNGSYIIATDLETALKEPLDIKVEKEGKICIPARKMFEIVKEVDTELLCESIDDQWVKQFQACMPLSKGMPGMARHGGHGRNKYQCQDTDRGDRQDGFRSR